MSARSKYDVASAALVMIGANPVASFSSSGTTEQIACNHLWQPCVDNWLSLYPWRFASRTTLLSREGGAPPDTLWSARLRQPEGAKAVQAVHDGGGVPIPFDRFEDWILCNASDAQQVFCVHTTEPPVQWWPGYFVALIEHAMAAKLSFALAGKLDLRVDLEKNVEPLFRLGKNADARQQTSRRLRVAGRGSILEARRA